MKSIWRFVYELLKFLFRFHSHLLFDSPRFAGREALIGTPCTGQLYGAGQRVVWGLVSRSAGEVTMSTSARLLLMVQKSCKFVQLGSLSHILAGVHMHVA